MVQWPYPMRSTTIDRARTIVPINRTSSTNLETLLHRARSTKWPKCSTPRNTQMITAVGRITTLKAASISAAVRSLVSHHPGASAADTIDDQSNAANLIHLPRRNRGASLNGHKAIAATVSVASIEFEYVRTPQYHTNQLNTWHIIW